MNYSLIPHLGQISEISLIGKPQFSHSKTTPFSILAISCIEIYNNLAFLMVMKLKEVNI